MLSVGRLFSAMVLLTVVTATECAASAAPCQSQSFEGSHFLVCAVDTRDADITLYLADEKGAPLRSFARLAGVLGPAEQHLRFAMNAGMFDKTGEPVGLYISDGKQAGAINLADGAGNFYMKPNGVFWADASGTLHITRSKAFAASKVQPVWATQSGPLLLENGAIHPQISVDGPSINIRNGVGLRDGHDAIFVISDDPVSFGRFARFFRDALDCPNALYLDGAISSIWVPATGRRDHDHPLGPIIAVVDKSN